jgi:hypothetical protein
MTKTEAVRVLLPQIHAMRGRGYSLPAIAGLLSEDGLVVSAATLRTYMKHAGEKKRPRSKRRRGVNDDVVKGPSTVDREERRPTTGEAKGSKGGAKSPASASPRGADDGTKKNAPEAATSPVARPNRERSQENSSAPPAVPDRRSAFVVRKDTEDI